MKGGTYQVGVYVDFNTFVHAFNNTIIGGATGFARSGSGILEASNNLVAGQTISGFAGGVTQQPMYLSSSNLSEDGSAPGWWAVPNATVVFSGSGDYHLDCTDPLLNDACQAGLDVGSNYWLPFNTDIDGELRPRSVATGDGSQVDETPWDIGADQKLVPNAVITSPVDGENYHAGSIVAMDGTDSMVPKGSEIWFAVLVNDGSDPMPVSLETVDLDSTFNTSMAEPSYVFRLIVANPGFLPADAVRRAAALPCQAIPDCSAVEVTLNRLPLQGPYNLVAEPLSATVVKLTWTDPNTNPVYDILRGNEPLNLTMLVGAVTGQTVYFDQTAQAGTTYFYQLVETSPQSASSAIVPATTPALDDAYLSLLPSTREPDAVSWNVDGEDFDYHDHLATLKIRFTPEVDNAFTPWSPIGMTFELWIDEDASEAGSPTGEPLEIEPGYGRDDLDCLVASAGGAAISFTVSASPFSVDVPNLAMGHHVFRTRITDSQGASRDRAFIKAIKAPNGSGFNPDGVLGAYVGSGYETTTYRPRVFGFAPPHRFSPDCQDNDWPYTVELRVKEGLGAPIIQYHYYETTVDETGYWEFIPDADLPENNTGEIEIYAHEAGGGWSTGRTIPLESSEWDGVEAVPEPGRFDFGTVMLTKVGGGLSKPTIDSTAFPLSVALPSMEPLATGRIRFQVFDRNYDLDATTVFVSNPGATTITAQAWMAADQNIGSLSQTAWWEADIPLALGSNSVHLLASDHSGKSMDEIVVVNRDPWAMFARIDSPADQSAYKSQELITLVADSTTTGQAFKWILLNPTTGNQLPGTIIGNTVTTTVTMPATERVLVRLVVATGTGDLPFDQNLDGLDLPCTLESSGGTCDTDEIELLNPCCSGGVCAGDGYTVNVNILDPPSDVTAPWNKSITFRASATGGPATLTTAYRWTMSDVFNGPRTLLTPLGPDGLGFDPNAATITVSGQAIAAAGFTLGDQVNFYVAAGVYEDLTGQLCIGSIQEDSVRIDLRHHIDAVAPGRLLPGEALTIYAATMTEGQPIHVLVYRSNPLTLEIDESNLIPGPGPAVTVTIPASTVPGSFFVKIQDPWDYMTTSDGVNPPFISVVAPAAVIDDSGDQSCTDPTAAEAATALTPGQTLTGTWCGPNDTDYFYFTAAQGLTYDITLNRVDTTSSSFLPGIVDPELFIVDPDGLVDSVNGYANDRSAANNNAAISGFVTPKNGMYAIACRTEKGQGDYEITLTRTSIASNLDFTVTPYSSRAVNVIEQVGQPITGTLQALAFDPRGLPASGVAPTWDPASSSSTDVTNSGTTGIASAVITIASGSAITVTPTFTYPAAGAKSQTAPAAQEPGAILGVVHINAEGVITRTNLPTAAEAFEIQEASIRALNHGGPQAAEAKILATCDEATANRQYLVALVQPCGGETFGGMTLEFTDAVPTPFLDDVHLTGATVAEQTDLGLHLAATCIDGVGTETSVAVPNARIFIQVADLLPAYTRGVVTGGLTCPTGVIHVAGNDNPFRFEVGTRSILAGLDQAGDPVFSAIEYLFADTRVVDIAAGWAIHEAEDDLGVAPEPGEPDEIRWLHDPFLKIPTDTVLEQSFPSSLYAMYQSGPDFVLLDLYDNLVIFWGENDSEWHREPATDQVYVPNAGLDTGAPWAGISYIPTADPFTYTTTQFETPLYPLASPVAPLFGDTTWEACFRQTGGSTFCSSWGIKNNAALNWIYTVWPFQFNSGVVSEHYITTDDWIDPQSHRTTPGKPLYFAQSGKPWVVRVDPMVSDDIEQPHTGTTFVDIPIEVWVNGPNAAPGQIRWTRVASSDPFTPYQVEDVEITPGTLEATNTQCGLKWVPGIASTTTASFTASTDTVPDNSSCLATGEVLGSGFSITKAPQEPGWYTIIVETTDDVNFPEYAQIDKNWTAIKKIAVHSFLVEAEPEPDMSCALRCEECAEGQIGFGTGNLRTRDADPVPGLPGALTSRAHDSLRTDDGLYGSGWTSALDASITVSQDQAKNAKAGTTYETVDISTESGRKYRFSTNDGGNTYVQRRPEGGTPAELTKNGGDYDLDIPGDPYTRRFSGANGWLDSLTSAATGQTFVIQRDGSGVPYAIDDSWRGRAVTIVVTGGHVSELQTSQGSQISFIYSGDGTLNTVDLDGVAIRTYGYVDGQLTASADGAGRILETHNFSAGAAASTISSSKDVTGVTWGASGPRAAQAGEHVVGIDKAGSSPTYYYQRWIGDRYRTVEVRGDCACSGNDHVYAYDLAGNLAREMNAHGYISEYTYTADGRRLTESRGMIKSDCDPDLDPTACWLTPEQLIAATNLVPSSATTQRAWVYGDNNWPNQATSTCTPSVLDDGTGRERCSTFFFNSSSGAWQTRSETGWTGTTPGNATYEEHTTTRTFYDSVTTPAFNPGGTYFQTAWTSEPQPAGMLKAVDGPRTDITDDIVEYVYYPDHDVGGAPVDPNDRGRLAATKNALGNISRLENYDAWGNARRTIDPNGVVSERTFDSAGRVETTTIKADPSCDTAIDPLCNTDLVSISTYKAGLGQLDFVSSPGGTVSQMGYDSYGRVLTSDRGPSIGNMEERTEQEYDPVTLQRLRNSQFASDGGGGWIEHSRTTSSYDSSGRLQTTTRPHYDGDTTSSEEHYTYDEAGNVKTFQDANHTAKNVEYFYDPLGRLGRVDQLLDEQASTWVTTSYAYDSQGNLTSVTDANENTTSYVIDDFGRTTQITSPVTGATVMTYSEANALATRTDARNVTMTNTYDAAGRLTGQEYDDHIVSTEALSFGYDDSGRQVRTEVVGGVIQQFGFDRRGQAVTATVEVDGTVYETAYTYDEDGVPKSVTYPSGRVVEYQVDYAGRPIVITSTAPGGGATETVLASVSYLPGGPTTSLDLGPISGRVTETHGHDWQYRRTTQTVVGPASTTHLDLGYTYDAAGNLEIVTDLVPLGDRGATYGYDDLSRLTSAGLADGSREYEYDAIGNLERQAVDVGLPGEGELVFSYLSNGSGKNEPILDGIAAYDSVPALLWSSSLTTDLAGNVTSDGATTYDPDLRNHLESRQLGGETLENTFTADGRNAKTERLVGGDVSHQISDLTGRRLAYHTASGWRDYVYLGDRLLGYFNDGEIAANLVVTDHIGMPVVVLDGAGASIWSARAEPYGQLRGTIKAGADPGLRYPGQWQDALDLEANCLGDDCTMPGPLEQSFSLFENGYRWYRPDWGRYTQSDPIGLKGGGNLFAYANGSPYRYLDEHGLFCTTDFVGHYFRGGGSTIDLAAVGLLGGVKGSPDGLHIGANFANQARRWSRAISIALCVGGRCGSFSRRFQNDKRYVADLTGEPCLFSVGNTSVLGEADCQVKANCDTKQFQYSCNLKYGLRDVFKDPADIFDLFPGEQELPGGTPYGIVGNWSDSISGTGKF